MGTETIIPSHHHHETTNGHERSIVRVPAIGEVVEVGSARAILSLNKEPGKDPVALRLGELVVVETMRDAVVGQVNKLWVNDDAKLDGALQVELTIVATIDLEKLTIASGASQAPSIGSRAYKPTEDLIRALVEDRTEIFESNAAKLKLKIAQSAEYEEVVLEFPPERLFGRHCAVLGTSGSGKSWSVAKLVEECTRFRSKVLLLDPTGEYESLESGVFHLHLGESTRDNRRSLQASLPYRQLTEADLVAIFKPTTGSQISKMRSAIKTLKLMQLEPKLATEGTFIKSHKNKLNFEAAAEVHRKEIENPLNDFDILKLPLQIELECVDPIRSPTEPTYWGGANGYDQSMSVPLINRIHDILNSDELATIFRPRKQPSVFEAMTRFLKDPKVSVLRVSFEFLPSTHRVREIVANALGRYILQLGRAGVFRQAPLIAILDEAHQALNSQLSDMSLEFPLEAFNIIAKEGRKYGLTLCLATQRPRDIPEDVLSQVGTFLVHRLVNDSDRRTVERASGAIHETVLQTLPSLTAGEAFVLGIDFPNPIRVKMIAPHNKPQSHGPNYQNYWGTK